MGVNERRQEILETLYHRRKDTMANLAFQFEVSIRTIRNDIDLLSLSYPLETVRGRYGGGVSIMDGFHLNCKYLKPEQKELLDRLSVNLHDNELAVMKSIIKGFALNK